MVKRASSANEQPIKSGLHALSLRLNASWSLLGNATYAISQLAMLVALARLGNTEQVGLYGWALAITTPAFLLASMQLRTVLAAEVEQDESGFGDYLGARLITTSVVFFLIIVGAWQIESHVGRLVILSVGLSKAIESVSDVIYGLFWQQNQMDCIAKSMMLRGLLGGAGFTLAYWQFDSLFVAQIVLALVWLGMLLFYDLPQARRLSRTSGNVKFHPSFRFTSVRRLAGLGLPAGILSWLTSLQVSMPRYFVEEIMGGSALGVFTALAYLLVGFELVARSVNYAALPRFAKLFQEAKAKEIHRLVVKLTLFGLVLGLIVTVGIALLSRPLIALLYGSEYVPYAHLLLYLVMISSLRILTMPLAMTLRSAKAYWQLTVVQAIAVLALTAACWSLVPRYGLEGCALALLLGLLVDITGRCLCHARLVRFDSVALPVPREVHVAA